MATPSKRSTSKKTVKKTSIRKKTQHRNPKQKKKAVKSQKTNFLHTAIIGLVFVIFSIAVGYSYFVAQKKHDPLNTVEKKVSEDSISSKKIFQELEKIKENKGKRSEYPEKIVKKYSVPVKPTAVAKKKEISVSSFQRDTDHNVALAYRSKRSKLVIIIDDVHTSLQLKAIKSLPLHVTPSIFPPYTQAKHSERLADGLEHFMIHLPMESGSARFNSQSKTLMTSFSRKQMHTRAKELRQLFPHAVYINNHTGSVFTKNYKAMKTLYEVLKAEGFVFVDSFTIGSSKVKIVAHEAGDAYVRRDIFIDNKHDTRYIHAQLKKAVKLAKKNGYAIAIGHPHKKTLEALRSAKPILKDVDVVYIDEIYQRR